MSFEGEPRIVRYGYPTIMEKQKRPRESTDLEEYDFIVPKNFT